MSDYENLRKSLLRLSEQRENLAAGDSGRSRLLREALAESVIRRFKACYDCLWKALKGYLNKDLGLADVPSSPRPLFRLANENGLLPSPAEKWQAYATARINISHGHDQDKARACLGLADDFIADAAALYRKMSGRKWK